jgi:hypothetical protein
MNRAIRGLALLAVMGALPAFSQVLLTDGNSSANIDPTSVGQPFERGMNNWTVDGTNHLFQQWFWYRVGNTAEATIDTISAPVVQQPIANLAKITYQNSIIKVETTYLLTGGSAGSSRSDIAESIRITNVSTAGPQSFSFFQYTDFDLNNTFGNDALVRTNSNAFVVSEGNITAAETISTPVAAHWQGSNTGGIYSSLINATATTLTDSGSPLSGDVSFAWQWDMTLNPGQTFLISKDKMIVPEPGTFLALGIGLAGLLAARKRRK